MQRTRFRAFVSFVFGASFILFGFGSCRQGSSKPNCDKMRACCNALRTVENGLPKEHEILCYHDLELDEGCVETISDIARFTPSKSLPAACR